MLDAEKTVYYLRKAKKGDKEAAAILLENNSLLIKSIIRRFKNKGVEYDDLYQLGCVGFLKAIKNFDEKFGVVFSTYAVPMILGEVKRFLRDDGSIKVSEFHFSHDKYAVKYGGSFFGNIYARFRMRQIEKVAAKLDKFIVLTKSDKKDWEPFVPNVTSIYNPLTFKSEEVAALDNKKCIAIGRLESQKNFRDLVAAWKYVAEEYPDWVLEIYGNGSLKESLQQQITSLGLDLQVRLMGSSSDIRSKMLDSSCLVMSSAYEGFPMVLLEAVETGLPMVSYDCPKGPAEIIIDGKSGYLVKPGDVEGLARRVCDVISDAGRRKEFGAMAKETAAQYSIDRIMEQWKTLFEGLMAK